MESQDTSLHDNNSKALARLTDKEDSWKVGACRIGEGVDNNERGSTLRLLLLEDLSEM